MTSTAPASPASAPEMQSALTVVHWTEMPAVSDAQRAVAHGPVLVAERGVACRISQITDRRDDRDHDAQVRATEVEERERLDACASENSDCDPRQLRADSASATVCGIPPGSLRGPLTSHATRYRPM